MSDQILSLSLVDRFDKVGKWPMIPSVVPERPLAEEEQADVQAHIELGIAIIRELLGEVDAEHLKSHSEKSDYYVSDRYSAYKLLTHVLLVGAKTPEQVRNLIAGFIVNCINDIKDKTARDLVIAKLPEDVRTKFKPVRPYEERREDEYEKMRLHYHHSYIGASTGHWPQIHGVNISYHFEEALSLRQRRRYDYEPNHDCFQTIVSDTQNVFCKHTGVREEGFVKRKIPEHKKMTPEKVSRLFSLPGLFEYINADAEMGDEVIASNLTIIAEYFCENEDVLYKNEVTKEDIDKWMKGKFERYKPSLNVATYIWARLLGTEFEEIALWIEQYILDLLKKDSPWVFELAGKTRDERRISNDLFDVYERAIVAAEERSDVRLGELLYMIPAKELLEASMASKNYRAGLAIKTLHGRASDLYVYLSARYTAERYENDFDGFCFDLFHESIQPLTEWRAIEGFELLDPMAIDGYSHARGWTALAEVLKKVVKRMEEMKPSELLKFKEAVIDRLPEPFKAKIMRTVTNIAEKWAATVSFEGYETSTLADMSMGAKGLTRPALVLPEGISLDAFCGEEFSRGRVDALAERAVLERHLRGVRGDEQIIRYLLDHRGTMVPVDLVAPRSDAPNMDIIKEFGESPDLLSLLSIATLLVYLGYDYNQVMAEVRMQAEISDMERHPDVTSIGAEYEQLGATPEGRIVDETRYSWLFNVLAAGGDRGSNEMKTPPTLSAVMQKYIFALITDPRFQFINTRMLWEMTARKDRCPSGIHVNVAIPKELPFSEELVRKYMAPVQEMQWLVNGGMIGPQHSARGKIRHWKSGSLLDVLDDKHTEMKVEYRSLSLDENGDYGKQIDMLQLLSSAAIQFMREKAGLTLSSSGRVLAQIYERFRLESLIILQAPGNVNVAIAARTLMEKFADAVRTELNRPKVSKKEGIVVVNG